MHLYAMQLQPRISHYSGPLLPKQGDDVTKKWSETFRLLLLPFLAFTMGQRHQLFVVARVRNRYRTLAVVHRQWLYEMGPIERCLRLIHIFEAEPNQIPIKQELRAACNKDDDF